MVTASTAASAPEVVRLGEHTVVLRAGVWLDPMAAKELRTVAFRVAEDGARELVLDLGSVVASDSRATAPLSELALGLVAYGCDVALATGGQELQALIDGVPVLREMEAFATVEEALAYLLRLPLTPVA
jgi:anti-anti-sigma regulatory factor